MSKKVERIGNNSLEYCNDLKFEINKKAEKNKAEIINKFDEDNLKTKESLDVITKFLRSQYEFSNEKALAEFLEETKALFEEKIKIILENQNTSNLTQKQIINGIKQEKEDIQKYIKENFQHIEEQNVEVLQELAKINVCIENERKIMEKRFYILSICNICSILGIILLFIFGVIV